MKQLLIFIALFAATFFISNCSREEKSTVVDWEGNEYKTKNYGGTWWMVENMRTTKTKDGQNIWVSSEEDKFSYTIPYCYFYDDNDADLKKKGCLYNWSAANQVCPDGWHLPTDADYEALVSYLNSVEKYCYNGNPYAIAKSMASNSGWTTSFVEGSPGYGSNNNTSGFNAPPTGAYFYPYFDDGGHFDGKGYKAHFWIAYEELEDGNNAVSFSLINNESEVFLYSSDKSAGFSVRCVKDAKE